MQLTFTDELYVAALARNDSLEFRALESKILDVVRGQIVRMIFHRCLSVGRSVGWSVDR